MRVAKAVAAVTLLMWTIQCVGVLAQDDLDLEALLDDLTEPTEEVVEEQPAVVENVEDFDMEAEEVLIEAPELEPPMDDEEIDEMSMEELLEEPELEAEEMDEGFEGLVDEVLDEVEDVEEMAEEVVEEAEDVEAAMEMADDEVMEEDDMAAEDAEEPMTDAAKAMAAQEEVKRQAMEVEGLKSLQMGFQALDQERYEDALGSFEDAIAKIPERRATIGDIQRAKWGAAEAHYRIALAIYKDDAGDLAEAGGNVQSAINYVPDHQGALSLSRKIEKKQERLERMAQMPTPVKELPDVIAREATVEELIDEGKQYYAIGDYETAEVLFDKVLLEDEFNTDAMRFLKRIKDKQFKISTQEREATVAAAMQEVRDSWNPPIKDEVELPSRVQNQTSIATKTQAEELREKMGKIIIPSIEFRRANIRDVVNFLVEASIAGDKEGLGVNIVLNLNLPEEAMEAAPQPAPSMEPMDDMFEMDEFDDFFGEPAAPVAPVQQGGGGASSIPTITLNLRRISLLEALKIITEVSGLKYRIEGNIVIITPAGVPYGSIVTRMYPVQPSILDVIIEREEETERGGDFIEMGGSQSTMRRGDVKDFFQKSGVPFPIGTSITYNPGISQLIVANTPDNLEIFERILAQLNVIPQQVEIEARFVEIAQNDLQELGLQWILTDNWEIAQKQGIAPIAGQERVQVDANSDGFTQGLRFWSVDRTTGAVLPASPVTQGIGQSAMGSILSISSVLTNPELSIVLQALDQSGGADLLSAPRVTTRSGVNAQIQVVREIIYPTEFEVTQPTIQSEGNLVTPPTVTPGGFETRETGVILNVTPTVGPDGYTIDLTMIPEVSELVDWIQYGSEVTLPSADAGDRTFTFNIPQPIFSSRHVTTSIVIWDGQTVVMGGLIREDLQKIEDKIPILGDIPILGRLFRNEGEFSQKRNLVIFVTARLVDPAGKPIHKMDAMAMPGGGTTTGQTEQ